MLSNHLILCHPRLLLSSVFPLQDVSYKRVISTWFSKILLCLLFLKNNQPEIILMPNRHTLGLESLLPFQGHVLGLGRWKGGAGGKEPSADAGDAGDEGSVLGAGRSPGGGLGGKEPSADAGDEGSVLGAGRSPGGGLGTPLQYSCLGNPVDRGAWQATVPGVAKGRPWLTEHARTDSLGILWPPLLLFAPMFNSVRKDWFRLT